MTKDEIMNMPAGREMDAAIARDIMKLEESNESGWWWINGMMEECPDYSTDISDAWTVLLKFKEFYIEYKDKEYFLMIGDDFDTSNENKSAPLAICRSALLATL